MKLGTIDIKKAYFGTTELTSSNAYLGEVPLIPSAPQGWQGLKITSTAGTVRVSQYTTDTSNPADMKYSLDGGTTWASLPVNATQQNAIALNVGDEMCLKGNNPNGLGYNNTGEYYYNSIKLWGYNTTEAATISGKIMSLIDNGVCGDSIPSCNGAFRKLFSPNANTSVVLTIDNLIFPNNTRPYCYEYMFYRCTYRTIAVVGGYPTVSLPATSSSDYCYRGMFYGSSGSGDLLTKGPYIWLRDTTGTNCMKDMFSHSRNLGTVYLRVQKSDTFSNADSWLYDVKSTGSIIVPEFSNTYNYNLPSGDGGKPSGWSYQADKWD